MFLKKILFLSIFCIHQYMVWCVVDFTRSRPVCKLSQSGVNMDSVSRIWTSRSFLHCVTECSQDCICQSVFYDKTTKLCYWNNNNPVVATSCGSLLYLQLDTKSSIPSTPGCCSLSSSETLTIGAGFVTLRNSNITVYIETVRTARGSVVDNKCREKNARVVMVDSAQKQRDLVAYLMTSGLQDSFYIGLRKTTGGRWQWSDRSHLNYSAWEGNTGGGDCVAIECRFGYRWNNVHCSPHMHYICERA